MAGFRHLPAAAHLGDGRSSDGRRKDVDGRDKPGHDEKPNGLRGHPYSNTITCLTPIPSRSRSKPSLISSSLSRWVSNWSTGARVVRPAFCNGFQIEGRRAPLERIRVAVTPRDATADCRNARSAWRVPAMWAATRASLKPDAGKDRRAERGQRWRPGGHFRENV